MTYDIGMYLAHLGQVAYPGAEVEMIQTMATMKNGVDQTTLCNMMWSYGDDTVDDETGQKGMLQYYVTGSANTEERVTIQGTNGRIVVHSPAHVPERVSLFKDEGRGKSSETVFDFPLPKDDWTTWNYPNSIGFTYEIQHVNEALRAGKKECDEFTWRDSIQLAEIVDEILKQAKSRDVFCATKRYEEQAELVTK
jgi:predicted dehydrogenase